MDGQTHDNTLVIFFSLSAVRDARYKNHFSLKRKRKALDLSRCLINHTYKIIKESGLNFKRLDESCQRGDTFDDRITNAIKDAFKLGWKNVIIVGNDCLSLTATDLKKSAELLSRGTIVSGGTADGGIYLLGVNINDFDELKLKALNWRTNKLFEDLDKYCKDSCCSLKLLDEKAEIDSVSDILKFEGSHSELIINILNIIAEVKLGFGIYMAIFFQAFHLFYCFSSRPPPEK